jgi:dienelactone hydrolase
MRRCCRCPAGKVIGPGDVAEWFRQGPAKPCTRVRFPASPPAVCLLSPQVVFLVAVIGFHPGFAPASPAESANITASVLMICCAEDPVVSNEDRRRFEDEMRSAHVADWRLEVYGSVGHSFTNPDISSRGLPGFFAYDERADRRSWSAMLALLQEVFD